MGIGPLELNGTIGRSQDFSVIKQNVDNKPVVDQSHLQMQFSKEVEQKHDQVKQADDTRQEQKRYDAKEKGDNAYGGDGGRRRKRKGNIPPEGRVVPKGQPTGFDVKI